MASFQTLPDELTLLVLRGLLLEDVLNVSRTSRYLRYITHSYPDVWKNTEDARHIPLLLGQTLSTVPTVLLPKLVARSVSISQTLSKPFLDPRRCTRLEIEAQTSSEDRAHDYWWRLTPKQIYSLPGGRIVLCRWDCKVEFYGAEKGEFIGRIELPESISMHWESFDCGRTMKFASLCSRIVDEKLELSILTYDIDFIPSIEPEEGFVMKLSVPSTIILPSIYTPTYFPGSILLRGSMVLVQADDHILVVNMDRRTGVMFMSDQPPEEHAFFFDHDFKDAHILKAEFHPSLAQLIIIEKEPNEFNTRYAIKTHDLPPILLDVPPYAALPQAPAFTSAKSRVTWTSLPLNPKKVYELPTKPHVTYVRYSVSNSDWVSDILLPGSQYLCLSLSDWTSITRKSRPVPVKHFLPGDNPEYGTSQLRHRLMVLNLTGMARSFASVYLGDSFGHSGVDGKAVRGEGMSCEVHHTELKFPDESDDRLSWKISMFDDVYGLGLAMSRKGVYVLRF